MEFSNGTDIDNIDIEINLGDFDMYPCPKKHPSHTKNCKFVAYADSPISAGTSSSIEDAYQSNSSLFETYSSAETSGIDSHDVDDDSDNDYSSTASGVYIFRLYYK